MVKKSGLTEGIARALEMPVALVGQYYRTLIEAGLLTSNGARGVNALPLTTLDAARVVIAILATDRAAEAPQAVADFGGLVYEGKGVATESKWPDVIAALPSSRRLEDVFAELLHDLRNGWSSQVGSEWTGCEAEIEPSSIGARISVPGLALEFVDMTPADKEILWGEKHVRWSRRVRVIRAIKGDVLGLIAQLFRDRAEAVE
jgi:hypothetical protein